MNKLIAILTTLAILTGRQLQAQDTGTAAISSTAAVKNNGWQNWVFFGTALFTATGAILAVSLDNGSPNPGQSH